MLFYLLREPMLMRDSCENFFFLFLSSPPHSLQHNRRRNVQDFDLLSKRSRFISRIIRVSIWNDFPPEYSYVPEIFREKLGNSFLSLSLSLFFDSFRSNGEKKRERKIKIDSIAKGWRRNTFRKARKKVPPWEQWDRYSNCFLQRRKVCLSNESISKPSPFRFSSIRNNGFFLFPPSRPEEHISRTILLTPID